MTAEDWALRFEMGRDVRSPSSPVTPGRASPNSGRCGSMRHLEAVATLVRCSTLLLRRLQVVVLAESGWQVMTFRRLECMKRQASNVWLNLQGGPRGTPMSCSARL